jgi:hypothetical protein
MPKLTEPNLVQIDPPASFSRTGLRILVALIVTGLLVGSYFYFGKRKPVATGAVTRVSLYPIHSAESDQNTEGTMGSSEQYDQLLVFAQVQVHNQSDIPLTITEMHGDMTLADSTQTSSRAASANDFPRLFGAYPKLAPLRSDPLLRDTTIPPGDNADGLLIFNYSLSKAQWDQKQKFMVSISFSNGTGIQLDATHI